MAEVSETPAPPELRAVDAPVQPQRRPGKDSREAGVGSAAGEPQAEVARGLHSEPRGESAGRLRAQDTKRAAGKEQAGTDGHRPAPRPFRIPKLS